MYDKTKYVGKKVRLYPGDTYYKYAIIEDVDALGWTFKITKSSERNREMEITGWSDSAILLTTANLLFLNLSKLSGSFKEVTYYESLQRCLGTWCLY